MNLCHFCGQSNANESRFCVDCGKKLESGAGEAPAVERALRVPAHRRPSPSVVRQTGAEPAIAIVPPARLPSRGAMITCSWCSNLVEAELPFCPHCGRRTDATLAKAAACPSCGATIRPEHETYCASCGNPIAATEKKAPVVKKTLVFSAKRRDIAAQLVVLDDQGEPKQMVEIDRPAVTLGRGDCDIAFRDDPYLSPRHAEFVMRDGALFVRDLGSSNRTWVFLEEPHALQDEDVFLIGSQLIQFRRAMPHGDGGVPEDGTRRIGSVTPGTDLGMLTQLRADGSKRDSYHLGTQRAIVIGRDTGDWTFPYDQTMSGRHAEVRTAEGGFVIEDLGSRNGVALAARGERLLRQGTRVLVGDQLLRVERV